MSKNHNLARPTIDPEQDRRSALKSQRPRSASQIVPPGPAFGTLLQREAEVVEPPGIVPRDKLARMLPDIVIDLPEVSLGTRIERYCVTYRDHYRARLRRRFI